MQLVEVPSETCLLRLPASIAPKSLGVDQRRCRRFGSSWEAFPAQPKADRTLCAFSAVRMSRSQRKYLALWQTIPHDQEVCKENNKGISQCKTPQPPEKASRNTHV